jgi:SepF-like predicted cell division protein (DUF552 family)
MIVAMMEIQEEEKKVETKAEMAPKEKREKHACRLEYKHEKQYINKANIGLLKDLIEIKSPYNDVVALHIEASRIIKGKTRGNFGNGPKMPCYFGGSPCHTPTFATLF